MRRLRGRILAWLLCLTMIMPSASMTAFAAEGASGNKEIASQKTESIEVEAIEENVTADEAEAISEQELITAQENKSETESESALTEKKSEEEQATDQEKSDENAEASDIPDGTASTDGTENGEADMQEDITGEDTERLGEEFGQEELEEVEELPEVVDEDLTVGVDVPTEVTIKLQCDNPHARFLDGGKEITSITLTNTKNTSKDVQLDVDSGWVLVSARSDSKYIKIVKSRTAGYYTITVAMPLREETDVNITAAVVENHDWNIQVDYEAAGFSAFRVMKSGKQISLPADGKLVVNSQETLEFDFKLNSGFMEEIYRDDSLLDADVVSYNEETGYYEYYIGHPTKDTTVAIKTTKAYEVTINNPNEVIWSVDIGSTPEETVWRYGANGKIYIKDGGKIFLSVSADASLSTVTVKNGTTNIPVYNPERESYEDALFEIAPTANMTLNIGVERYKFPVTIPTGVTVTHLGYVDYAVLDGGKTIGLDYETTLMFSLKVPVGKSYSVAHIYMEDGVEHKKIISSESYDENDLPIYEFGVGGNTKGVVIEEKKTLTITSQHVYLDMYEADKPGYIYYTGEGVLSPETKVLVANGGEYALDLSLETGYELLWVSADGTESGAIVPDENGYYHIKVTGDMTVMIKTQPEPQLVDFVNNIGDAEITVETSEKVVKDEFGYKLIYGADGIGFQVRMPKGEPTPQVGYIDEWKKIILIDSIKVDVQDENKVYDYYIDAEKLPENSSIVIEPAGGADKLITLQYKAKEAETLSATVDTLPISPISSSVSGDTTTDIYQVPFGKTIAMEFGPKEGYTLEQVERSIGTTIRRSSMLATIKVSVPAMIDTDVKVVSKAMKRAVISDNDGNQWEIELGGMKYSSYTMPSLAVGAYEVKYYEGTVRKNITNVGVSGNYDGNVEYEFVADKGIVKLTVKKEALSGFGRGEYRFNLHIGEDFYELPIKVCDTLEKIQIGGGGDSNAIIRRLESKIGSGTSVTIDPMADRRLSYTITTVKSDRTVRYNPTIDTLKVKTEGDGVVAQWDAKYRSSNNDRKRLNILTNSVAKNNAATVILYKTVGGVDKEFIRIKVNVKESDVVTKGDPSLALSKADDANLTLTMKEPAGANVRPYRGKQFFKIEVTPKAGTDPVPAEIAAATAKPFWVEREYPVLLDYPDVEELTDAIMAPIDRKNEQIQMAFHQNITVKVNNNGIGAGQAYDYDVKLTVVQTHPGKGLSDLLTDEATATAFVSSSRTISASTLAPVYETKVGLKKKTTKAYTGQSNVLAAIATFSKGTVSASVTAKDMTAGISAEEQLQVTVLNDTDIYVSATGDTKLGKHTIEVRPVGTPSMYQDAAKLDVTVEKGIESMEITPASSVLLKNPNSAASMTTTLTYNVGDTQPKVKKATYEIVDENGEAFTEDDPRYGMITVKNGKVTVDKKYDMNAAIDYNIFRVKATAADYKGSEVTALSKVITVKSDKLMISCMRLLKWNEETGKYDVVGDSGVSLTTGELAGTILAAFPAGHVPTPSYYKKELADSQIDINDLTFKSGNKAVTLTDDGRGHIVVNATKIGKNIKLTADTKDGGKQKGTFILNIVYNEPTELGLEMCDENGISLTKDVIDAAQGQFKGTINTPIMLYVKQAGAGVGEWEDLSGVTNLGISIAKGKLLSSDPVNGVYKAIVTGEEATITLTDKTAKKSKVYKIKNEDYHTEAPPTVKVLNTLVFNTEMAQTIDVSVKENNKYLTLEGKLVKLEVDQASAVKSVSVYESLMEACDTIGGEPVELTDVSDTEKKLSLDFEGVALPTGTYKLVATFGNIVGEEFIADAKPVTIAIKVQKPKAVKGSFAPTTTYTLSQSKEQYEFELTGVIKPSGEYRFTDIFNCNIKGYENSFLDYFEFDPETQTISLIDENDWDYLAGSSGANDRSAYLVYEAQHGDDGYGNPYTTRAVVKITVKFVR